MPDNGKKADFQTPPATDPTAVGPPPPGAKISPDGKATSEVKGTGNTDKAKD